MKTAILTEPGNLELREAPTPNCPAGGVLIKVKACGICSADVKMISQGHKALIYPRILGHEIAGIVAMSRTKHFKEGDRVQVAPGLSCQTCFQCRRGADNQCENREILGFTRDGGFADYLSVPIEGSLAAMLNPLPEHVSYVDATLAEPLACCINAQEKINIAIKDTVLIVGAGPLGILHAGLARMRGAEKILIAEVEDHRRRTAKTLGVCQVLDPSGEHFFQAVMDATDQRGVDAIIFACSECGLDQIFFKMLAPGGRISLFSGTPDRLSRLQLDSNLIHYYEFLITGAYGCTAAQNRQALNMIASFQLPVQKIITHRVSLDNIHQGLENTRSKKALKSIVEV
ncbi:MAG: alcohol dehydrogenase catalytic domain-containing protein [Proteobacteria bacterium]|nr:alcohol dehydrogenase catalytic domain-containing protein [Pseudomonadota bacterium]